MKSFGAEVVTQYDTYYIDYKPNMQPNNRFAVWSNRRGAVYLESVQDALNQIDFYEDQDIEWANIMSEAENNQ